MLLNLVIDHMQQFCQLEKIRFFLCLTCGRRQTPQTPTDTQHHGPVSRIQNLHDILPEGWIQYCQDTTRKLLRQLQPDQDCLAIQRSCELVNIFGGPSCPIRSNG